MTSHLQDAERSVVGEQAAKWLTELTDGNVEEREAFVAWLKQSPRHIEEFLLISATWHGFAQVPLREQAQGATQPQALEIERIVAEARAATTANVIPLANPAPSDEGSEAPHSKPFAQLATSARTRGRARIAAGIAAAIAVLTFGILSTPALEHWIGPDLVQTSVGEQRTVRLADGSIVYLNARSRIRVTFSATARNIELDQGEAIFKVAHDASRPFRVHTDEATVQAIGTQFNVYRRASGSTVSVLEGKVEVRTLSARSTGATSDASGGSVMARIAAGEQASITAPGEIIKQPEPDIAAAVAWRDRRLVFRAARLEDIAAEFSRYGPRRIQLEDDAAREKRITGTFDADDPGSLVLFLEKLDDLSVQRDGSDGFVIRGSKAETI